MPAQQQQQSGAYRAQPQQQFVGPAGPSGSTPPPFNYAEYGIPTDVGSATGQANNNSPFNLDNFGQLGQQNRPQQQAAFPFGGAQGNNGDDFGIFGNNNNNNNNNNNGNLPLIPVLEDGVNNNANNVNNNGNGGFGIPGIVGPNDFSVAASDFEPLNILDTLVPLNGYPNGAPNNGAAGISRAAGTQPMRSNGMSSTSSGNKSPLLQNVHLPRSGGNRVNKTTSSSSNTVVTTSNSTEDKSNSNNAPSSAALVAQRRHYKLAVSPSNLSNDLNEVLRAKRSISERPNEQISKVDPNSAYAILNLDPQYTNPNQGVYSYYPAYNNPL